MVLHTLLDVGLVPRSTFGACGWHHGLDMCFVLLAHTEATSADLGLALWCCCNTCSGRGTPTPALPFPYFTQRHLKGRPTCILHTCQLREHPNSGPISHGHLIGHHPQLTLACAGIYDLGVSGPDILSPTGTQCGLAGLGDMGSSSDPTVGSSIGTACLASHQRRSLHHSE